MLRQLVRRFDLRLDEVLQAESVSLIEVDAMDLPRARGELANRYEPVSGLSLKALLGGLGIDTQTFSFIDLGSGKGRALTVAALFPFREVIGVELSPALHAIAENRCDAMARSGLARCGGLRSVNMDAESFTPPAGDCVIFMFNPFHDEIVGAVAETLRQSAEAGRRVIVIYYNPVCRRRFEETDAFRPRAGSLLSRALQRLLSDVGLAVFEAGPASGSRRSSAGLRELVTWPSRPAAASLSLTEAAAVAAVVTTVGLGAAVAAIPPREAPRLRLSATSAAFGLTPSAVQMTPDLPLSLMPGPPPLSLQPLSPDEARAWNAAHPISASPNPAAVGFTLRTGEADRLRALDCLTSAVYYEAGSEDLEGQRAVAQVVINRVRHPAFPKSVCGVVFQGSALPTGCQFTFTCDGSLSRPPARRGWAEARKVADAALAGYVMGSVGYATHYHANYVAPYWSPSMVKVANVGAHIFYRWTGAWGAPSAFTMAYAGVEPVGLDAPPPAGPAPIIVAEAAPVAPLPEPAAEARAPLLPVRTDDEITARPPPANKLADLLTPDQLDWQGRPRAKWAPRLAMPSPSTGLN
jgi:SAM-dependent methyltransferase